MLISVDYVANGLEKLFIPLIFVLAFRRLKQI